MSHTFHRLWNQRFSSCFRPAPGLQRLHCLGDSGQLQGGTLPCDCGRYPTPTQACAVHTNPPAMGSEVRHPECSQRPPRGPQGPGLDLSFISDHDPSEA